MLSWAPKKAQRYSCIFLRALQGNIRKAGPESIQWVKGGSGVVYIYPVSTLLCHSRGFCSSLVYTWSMEVLLLVDLRVSDAGVGFPSNKRARSPREHIMTLILYIASDFIHFILLSVLIIIPCRCLTFLQPVIY